MGDNLGNPTEELTSYTETFEKSCPFFIAIGMSYDQFWYEDCWVANAYLKAYKIRKDQLNEQLWLQGVYIYEALCDVSPVLHAFSKKGTRPIPFTKKPYSFDKKEEKYTEKENEKERAKAEIYFKEWANKLAKKFNKGG